jgi:hypothetical protein
MTKTDFAGVQIALRLSHADWDPAVLRVIQRRRSETWGWGLECAVPGEFPVVFGFFISEDAAKAVATKLLSAGASA